MDTGRAWQKPTAQAISLEKFCSTDRSAKTVKLFHLKRFAIYGISLLTTLLSYFVAYPVIHGPSQSNITSSVGQQVVLPCSATGIDTPTASWRLEGVDVGTTDSSRLTLYANGSLVINNASIMDSGDYLCTAKNLAGSVNSTTTLVVNGKV